MAILFVRTIIVYALVITALRLMGKRQIGELQPSELVVAIMISDLACVPMSDISVPLAYGVIPIFTLVICEVALSFLCLKSEKARIILSGRPQMLMKDGKLCYEEMKKSRVNLDDLLEELRKNGFYSLNDVSCVILETGGNISVIPDAKADTPTLNDIGVHKTSAKIPYTLIADGKIRHSELKRLGKDQMWLDKVIHSKGYDCVKDIFVLSVDSEDNIYIQKRN